MSNLKLLSSSIVQLFNDCKVNNKLAYDALVFLVCMYGLRVHNKDPKLVSDDVISMLAKQHIQGLIEAAEAKADREDN